MPAFEDFGHLFDRIKADEEAEQQEELDKLRGTYSKYERPLARAFRDATLRALPTTPDGDPIPEEFEEELVKELIEGLRNFAAIPRSTARRPLRSDEDNRPRPEPRAKHERSDSDRTDRSPRARVQPPGRKDEEQPRSSSNNDRDRTGDSDSQAGRDDKTKPRSRIWDRLSS
jgi:hypothetical protein